MGKGSFKWVGILSLFLFSWGKNPLPPLPVVLTQCGYQQLRCKELKKYPAEKVKRLFFQNLKRCERGEGEGCLMGGLLLKFGPGNWTIPGGERGEIGKELFKKGCQLGNGESCGWLGALLEKEGNYREGVAQFEKGCRLGSGFSCNRAGWVYWFGEGNRTIEKDLKKASHFFSIGCQLGNGDSCNNLGVLISDQQAQGGIEPAELYNLGCQLGSGQGCASFGYWLEGEDEREPRNLVEAYHFYRKGCELGVGWGCERAGKLQEEGVNSPPNYRLARHFFEKGCQLKDGGACSQLGELYAGGKGVPKDLKRAYHYLKMGCELGDFEWGCNRAAELEEELKKR
jgi:hypothetical protein